MVTLEALDKLLKCDHSNEATILRKKKMTLQKFPPLF